MLKLETENSRRGPTVTVICATDSDYIIHFSSQSHSVSAQNWLWSDLKFTVNQSRTIILKGLLIATACARNSVRVHVPEMAQARNNSQITNSETSSLPMDNRDFARSGRPVLKKISPYWYPYRTNAKARWFDREILEVISTEFRDRSVEYYVSCLSNNAVGHSCN